MGTGADAAARKAAIPGEPTRPGGVRLGNGGDDGRCDGRVCFASMAGDADGSRAGVAGLMVRYSITDGFVGFGAFARA